MVSGMDRLVSGARLLGVELGREQVEAFQLYYRELVEWNRRVNLTSITGLESVQVLHFLDSLAGLLVLSDESRRGRLLDLGTGAGFPGLPLKMVLPGLSLTLVESVRKKAEFLRHLVGLLGLTGVEICDRRSEELAREGGHRGSYDVVCSRGVASLNALVEMGLPFCRIGGAMVAYKKRDVEDELKAAERAIALLGGRVRQVAGVPLSGLEDRALVVIEKIVPTPERFPRRPGMPAKRPM